MAVPSNNLQVVQTYQMAQLAYLLNFGCFIGTSNKKFKDFHKFAGNRGDTVLFDLPPRYVTQSTLTATFQESTQRAQSLTVDKAVNTSYAFTSQQMIFQVEDYMRQFGKSATAEIATEIEADVADLARTQPYRFFGDGVSEISSYNQLSLMLARYRTFGFPHESIKVYLSDISVPQIVGSGLNQFVMNRNEDEAQTWMVGDWMGVEYYQSNLLPIHEAGNVGNDNLTLTVVSTDDPTGDNITQITCSGAALSDADAIKQYDSAYFIDSASGKPRFLTFVGHKQTAEAVQFQVTADAASDGAGNVVLNVAPVLCSTSGNPVQNMTANIVAGMQIKVLPSHRCGLIVGGDALYLAMPQLPDQSPFITANTIDEETGASIRLTHGATFGENKLGFVHDAIWGRTAVPEYLMKVVHPL